MTISPRADRAPGAPHPRENVQPFDRPGTGRGRVSWTAFNAGRLHHGWMLTGPQGVGKATLAWRIAKFLLATPSDLKKTVCSAPRPRRKASTFIGLITR